MAELIRSGIYFKSSAPIMLPLFHISEKPGSQMAVQHVHQSNQNSVSLQKGLKMYTVWALCYSPDKHTVPVIGGFISTTGHCPIELTTIDYYPSITGPITEYNLVKELLSKCARATVKVGHHYVITTFDIGVCIRLFLLSGIVQKRPHYSYWSFHTIMDYLEMLGRKMPGVCLL